MTNFEKRVAQTSDSIKNKRCSKEYHCCCNIMIEDREETRNIIRNRGTIFWGCNIGKYQFTRKGNIICTIIALVIILTMIGISAWTFDQYHKTKQNTYNCRYTGFSPKNDTLYGYEYECLVNHNSHIIENKISYVVPESKPGDIVEMVQSCSDNDIVKPRNGALSYCKSYWLGVAIPLIIIGVTGLIFMLVFIF